MPLYACICEKCERPIEEFVCTVAEREKKRCPDKKCRGKLTNDYARHETSNFQLKGDNWPGKLVSIENKIRKDNGL